MTDDADRSNGGHTGQVVRVVLALLIAAAIVAVGIDNRDDVRIGYVIGDRSAPMWLALVLAAVAGVVIGWLVKHRPGRR